MEAEKRFGRGTTHDPFRGYTIWCFLIIFCFIYSIGTSLIEPTVLSNASLDLFSSRKANYVVEGEYMTGIFSVRSPNDIYFSEDHIVLNGFTADINIDYRYSSENFHLMYFILSNIENNTSTRKKSISINDEYILNDGEVLSEVISYPFKIKTHTTVLLTKTLAISSMIILFVILMNKKKSRNTKAAFYFFYLSISALWLLFFISDKSFHKSENIIIYIGLLTFYAIIAVLMGKKVLRPLTYTAIIIIVSTYFLFVSSYIFGQYYVLEYDLFSNEAIQAEMDIIENIRMNSLILYIAKETWFYIRQSIRFFFEFPSQDMFGFVSLFQFALGKIYDVIIFGSIANYIIKLAQKSPRKGEQP